MFRILNPGIRFPSLYPKVERKLPTVSDKGWDKVGGFTLRDKETYGVYADYMPQPGLQEELCACEANLIFICGAATGGKTYGMYLTALYGITHPGFTATLFSYREKDSQRGSSIFRDGIEVLGNYANCDYVSSGNIGFRFPQYNSQLQLANFNYNVNNPSEWSDYKEDMKKRQSSLIEVDEGTKMEEKAMLYLFSRNRDSSGMTPQFIIAFNPEYEHFTCQVLNDAGYMESVGNSLRVRKDMRGKIRYFYLKGKGFKTAVWGDTPEEVCEAAGVSITDEERAAGITEAKLCKSFTCFVSNAAENRKLVYATDGQSVANLAASGDAEALRDGLFTPRDNEEINIDRAMVHALWENPVNNDSNRYATLDVSRSVSDNSDDSPLVIWEGLQIVAIEMLHVDLKTLVATIQERLHYYNVPIEHFAFDSGGIGEYLRDFTSGIPVKGNMKCVQEYDQYGNQVTLERYFDLRSQLHGKMEAMFRMGEISCKVDKYKILRYGKKGTTRQLIDILFDEINVFITTDRNGKIYYRKKEEYKDKFKSSPDLMDAIILRAFFELDTRERKQPSKRVPENAYFNLVNRPRIVNPWRGFR